MSKTLAPSSAAEWIASQAASVRQECLNGLSDEAAAVALYDWPFWARPSQRPPAGDWRIWLLLAGRGFGKTRTGAEWIRARVDAGIARRIALVAPTPADARDVMIQGESGLLAIAPPWNRPLYEPSKRRLSWPNGTHATIYSGHEPDQLRGPQHDTAWADELASWQYVRETWDNLQFGMRLGDDPQICVTPTPKSRSNSCGSCSRPRTSTSPRARPTTMRLTCPPRSLSRLWRSTKAPHWASRSSMLRCWMSCLGLFSRAM